MIQTSQNSLESEFLTISLSLMTHFLGEQVKLIHGVTAHIASLQINYNHQNYT